jgi:CPA2 family monovalent cation:H+ antiporter-2
LSGNFDLIATVAAGLTAALGFGYATTRVGLSPIVGYLLAGVLIGPHTPGFVGDVHIAHQLAEIGVILLMFGVGLHFHLKDLLAVRSVAIPGAVGQSLVATLLAVLVFGLFDIPWQTGVVIGMAMAVASTVVLMRVLMDANALNSGPGHVAVGWLIVEDIFTVVLLVLIPILGGRAGLDAAAAEAAAGGSFWATLGVAMLKLGILVALVLVVGGRIIPKAMAHVARLRSRELFTLAVLVISNAIAVGSYFFFGASMALGAFLAGMVVAQSPVSHQAAADALPMRDAFAVLFFVSVGMLFDPGFLLAEPMMVLAALAIILLAKPLAALVIVAVLGHSARTALTVAIGLAQIGEFSFILSDLARQHGLMPDSGHNVLVAAAIISITLNPLLFSALPRLETWLRGRPRLWQLLNGRAERRAAASNRALADHPETGEQAGGRLAVVVGYGPVGRSVHRMLRDAKVSTVIVDLNLDTVSSLRRKGQAAVFGDASHESILEQADIRQASHLVLTLPESADRSAIVSAAKQLNPNLRILVRARYLRERDELEMAGATAAVFEELESAVALGRLVLADTGLHRGAARKKLRDLRLQLILENVTNIGAQRLRSVMVPWARVRWLSAKASRTTVLAQIAQERFSRWPVLDPATRQPVGYLHSKDLIARAADSDWGSLIRPLKTCRPDDTIEAVLLRMQDEGDSVYVVSDQGMPMGLVTLGDMLEQVFGRIEDEYPHEAPISLHDALATGGMVMRMGAESVGDALGELAAAVPVHVLPPGWTVGELAAQANAREEQMSTDLGNGVAIPHVRCPGLQAPVVVFGRHEDGLVFSPDSSERVRLLFLLVTPAESPEMQLALLKQLVQLCAEADGREALVKASSPAEVLALVHAARSAADPP